MMSERRRRERAALDTAVPAVTRLDVLLERAVAFDFVRPSDDGERALSFKHVLVQEAVSGTLLKNDRRILHRRVAGVLEQLYPERLDENAALLAEHYALAQDDAKTYAYALRAGDRARAHHASAEARAEYARALEALERIPANNKQPTLELELLLRQVDASMFTDDPARNLARLDRAEALARQAANPTAPEQSLELGRIALARGLVYFWRNDTRAALASFHQVLPIAHRLDDSELATLPLSAIGSVLSVQGQFAQAAPLLEQALPLLERSEDWSDWVVANGFLAFGQAARGDYAGGVARGKAGVARALESANLTAVAQGHNLLGLIYLEGGDYADMLTEGIACATVAEQSGDRMYQFIGLGVQAWALSRLGQHARAFERVANSALLVSDLQSARILADDWRAAALAELALAAGEPDQALTQAADAVTTAQEVDGLFAEGIARRVWGEALAALTPPRPDEALEQLNTSLELLDGIQAFLEAALTHCAAARVYQLRGAPGDLARAREHAAHALAQYEAAGLAARAAELRQWLEGMPESRGKAKIS